MGWPTPLQNLGQLRLADAALDSADKLAKKSSRTALQAAIESSLGTVYMFEGDPDDGEALLKNGLKLARQLHDKHLTASALNNLANYDTYERRFDQAMGEYDEPATLARSGGEKLLAARIQTNLVKCAMTNDDDDKAQDEAFALIDSGPGLPDSHEKALALLGAGKACIDLTTEEDTGDEDVRRKAFLRPPAGGEDREEDRRQPRAFIRPRLPGRTVPDGRKIRGRAGPLAPCRRAGAGLEGAGYSLSLAVADRAHRRFAASA